jgi:ankyrin repeat protein
MDINDKFIKACAKEDLPTASRYLEQGANIHVYDDFALRWAAISGHLKVVNVLRKAAGDTYKCRRCIIRSTCLKLCGDFLVDPFKR